jgi:hypothetical protein
MVSSQTAAAPSSGCAPKDQPCYDSINHVVLTCCDSQQFCNAYYNCVPSSAPALNPAPVVTPVLAPETAPVTSPVFAPKPAPMSCPKKSPVTGSCINFGETCCPSDCCRGGCYDGKCCVPDGDPCESDSQCCTNLKCFTKCKCSGPKVACVRNEECCSGTCKEGTCTDKDDNWCMSGNTGVFVVGSVSSKKKSTKKAKTKKKKSGKNGNGVSTLISVKDLQIGDTILGMDEQKQSSDKCKVVFKGSASGQMTFYGNYTKGHYVLDPLSKDNVVSYDGAFNVPSTSNEGYDVLTSCPLGKDESGFFFSPTTYGLCNTATLSWKDYLNFWKALYKLSTILGIYDYSAFVSKDSASQSALGVCNFVLKCTYDEKNCDDLEKWSVEFYNQVLTAKYKKSIQKKIRDGKGSIPSVGQGAVTYVLHRM